jgi:hypothetical protein
MLITMTPTCNQTRVKGVEEAVLEEDKNSSTKQNDREAPHAKHTLRLASRLLSRSSMISSRLAALRRLRPEAFALARAA